MTDYQQKGSRNKAPVGVYEYSGKIYLILKTLGKNTEFELESSTEGLTFETSSETIQFKSKILKKDEIDSIHLSNWTHRSIVTYLQNTGKKRNLYSAVSGDKKKFDNIHSIDHITEAGAIVADYKIQNNYVLFYGGDHLRLAYSKNLMDWEIVENKLHSEPKNFFGKNSLIVAGVNLTHQGILIFYWENRSKGSYGHFLLKVILVDPRNPGHVIEKFGEPIWETPSNWAAHKITPVGIIKLENKLLSYWKISGKGLFVITHPFVDMVTKIKQNVPYVIINKLKKNPLLAPIVNNFWESKATFNPAAVHEKNKVHIIYRAIGDDDVSVLGYASSTDGVHFDDRHPKPIYVPRKPFEISGPYRPRSRKFSPYMSGGGGYGGIEDPRITKISNKFYMTYVAYNGWSHPRIAMTSIDEVDFHGKNWDWESPVLISKPNEVNKNACILSEKVNGKYVFLHRLKNSIWIDYKNNLKFQDDNWLQGKILFGPKEDRWDSEKIGIGPAPIKINEGWLLIYHSLSKYDGMYRLGAALMDKNNPSKVLKRLSYPVLEPVETYEHAGLRPGTVFACGAVLKDENLYIYYGGSDQYVCVATARLEVLVGELMKNG